MKEIWEFKLSGIPGELIRVEMPAGAQVLDAQLQCDVPTLWAVVNKHAAKVPRLFMIFGTGWSLPTEFQTKHLKTFQIGGGVWHLFEVME